MGSVQNRHISTGIDIWAPRSGYGIEVAESTVAETVLATSATIMSVMAGAIIFSLTLYKSAINKFEGKEFLDATKVLLSGVWLSALATLVAAALVVSQEFALGYDAMLGPLALGGLVVTVVAVPILLHRAYVILR